jgi:hypothetical protein
MYFFFLPRCSHTWERAPISEHRADICNRTPLMRDYECMRYATDAQMSSVCQKRCHIKRSDVILFLILIHHRLKFGIKPRGW